MRRCMLAWAATAKNTQAESDTLRLKPSSQIVFVMILGSLAGRASGGEPVASQLTTAPATTESAEGMSMQEFIAQTREVQREILAIDSELRAGAAPVSLIQRIDLTWKRCLPLGKSENRSKDGGQYHLTLNLVAAYSQFSTVAATTEYARKEVEGTVDPARAAEAARVYQACLASEAGMLKILREMSDHLREVAKPATEPSK